MAQIIIRKVLRYSLLLASSALFTFAVSAQNEQQIAQKAQNIHKKILTIDTHNDSALRINNPNSKYAVANIQSTFQKMKDGGLDAAFFAIFVAQESRDSAGLAAATAFAETQLEMFKKYTGNYKDAKVACNSSDLFKNKREGKTSVILAIENGYVFQKDISLVKHFADMGVIAVTLCHNKNNDICDASMDTAPEHHGLSQFGIAVIKEMNRLKMIIDVSHASTESLFDILDVSKLPIVASHSGVWNIKNHNRNLKDEEIKAIAAKGGLIQVATGRFFLSDKPKEEVTVTDIANHIDYVVKLVGINHVGIGTDFDGGGGVVGLEGADKMQNITIELLKRGYSEGDLEKFWGKNLVNILRKHGK